jgi:hypothetical protein
VVLESDLDKGGAEQRSGGAWHDQQPVMIAAGIAALLLIALLIYAVWRTSHPSFEPPSPGSFDTPSSQQSGYRTTATSTSYTVPSVQTSQDNPGVTPPSSSDGPSVDEAPGGGGATTTTEWTPTNPYLTTTPTNAGHI